jgi:hypothetical protein
MPTVNTGGRKSFTRGERVKYLTIEGVVSDGVYLVDPGDPAAEEEQVGNVVRSDRKGQIVLRPENGVKNSHELKVHFRRVLPLSVEGKAPVIESGDKYRTICPSCNCVAEVVGRSDTTTCSNCEESFQLYWLGTKPMNVEELVNTEETETKLKAESKPKAEAKPKAEPKPRAARQTAREVQKVDFAAIVSLPDCELWTKSGVKFDHVDIDVQSHALLYIGDSPRKLCFNTYDGALGKKASDLPLEQFQSDTEVADAKRPRPWFDIKDLDKARAKLAKDGYTLHQ